jgi:hypothetical protein
VVELNKGGYRVPTLVLADGAVLTEPGNSELKVRLGITNRASKPFYDVIIIGGGPAGLTAAIYTGRDALETLIVEQAGLGGQAGLTQLIDNFPGFEKGVGGAELADRLATQARRFGAEALQGEQTTDIYRDGQYLVVKAANKREFIGRAVLIASGSRFRKLNVPGEEELTGAGVHYCATCDGPFYKGKTVVVVGGGIVPFHAGPGGHHRRGPCPGQGEPYPAGQGGSPPEHEGADRTGGEGAAAGFSFSSGCDPTRSFCRKRSVGTTGGSWPPTWQCRPPSRGCSPPVMSEPEAPNRPWRHRPEPLPP